MPHIRFYVYPAAEADPAAESSGGSHLNLQIEDDKVNKEREMTESWGEQEQAGKPRAGWSAWAEAQTC